jgi:hypothetical protein
MYKVLWAIAVVAVLALGTSIITAVFLHSAQAKDNRQIATLDHEQSVEQSEITSLRAQVRAKNTVARTTAVKNNVARVTAVGPRCALPQPIGQPGFAVASPELLCTIRQASFTAWNARAGIPFSSDTSASGHCG